MSCEESRTTSSLATSSSLTLMSEPTPMTAAEAHAAAATEGLVLLRAENSTGFKGVSRHDGRSKPFEAKLTHGGRSNHLG